MIRSIFWLTLAISLLFNVFFLAGYLQARGDAEGTDETVAAIDRVSDVLNLDGAQAETFQRLRSAMTEENRAVRGAMETNRSLLADELARDEPDIERVRELMTRQAELHRQRRLAGAERFSEFMTVLSPDQCGRLASELGRGRRGFPPPPPGEPLRFDADGDGSLNATEQAAYDAHRKAEIDAHLEHMRRKHEQRNQRRQEIRQRFDADGDGHIDETERVELMKFMRSQGMRGRRGHHRGGERGERGGPQ